jgi:hypothetical protein
VEALCTTLGVGFVRHDVVSNRAETSNRERERAPSGNARGCHDRPHHGRPGRNRVAEHAARQRLDGLSPMVDDPTKPLRDVRRSALHDFVAVSGFTPLHDETNDSADFRRNRVRHELLPLMEDVAGRDVVPLFARQAGLMHEERVWLDQLSRADHVTDPRRGRLS